MKIESINVPAGLHGLKEIRFTGLSNTVVLAGPNGGGKSRVLRAVAEIARAKMTEEEIARNQEQIQQYQRGLQSISAQINTLRAEGIEDHRIDDAYRNLEQHQKVIDGANEALARHALSSLSLRNRKPVVVDFRIENLSLKNSKERSIDDLATSRTSMSAEVNTRLATEYGLSALHHFMMEHVQLHSTEVDSTPEQRAQSAERMARLKSLVHEFLETELLYDVGLGPMLFGRPIAQANLSDGQKVLLQILLTIFFQDSSPDELVIMMDEPENHLHPAALIGLIERVRRSSPNAQIWIATHSLNVVAHFDSEQLWLVKEGRAEFAGKKADEVLRSLVGNEEGAIELMRFLSLPDVNAAIGFASQCLAPPPVADTPVGDPQLRLVLGILEPLFKEGRPVRVLDLGMGKGRLLREIHQLCEAKGVEVSERVDYVGFNPKARPSDRDICKGRLESAFGTSDLRYFESEAEVVAHAGEKFDLAVMCNVLHEIPLDEWQLVFGPRGYLAPLLSDSGLLLILEDQLLKHGERAHAFDFLVLDHPELVQLFAADPGQIVSASHPDARYADRLKLHAVPSALVGRVSQESTAAAIRVLARNSMERVKELKRLPRTFDSGRRYAFWAHQHLNSSLAYEACGGTTPEAP